MGLFRRQQPDAALSPAVVEDRWAHVDDAQPERARRQHKRWAELPDDGLERAVWTHEDFPDMGWHDACVWGFAVEHGEYPDPEDYPEDPTVPPATDRLLLDLDYITRWVDPVRPSKYFTYWVAPCTLVFTGVTELDVDIDSLAVGPHELEDVYAVRGGWHVAGHATGDGSGFDIRVAATGFRQTFRRRPVHTDAPLLTLTDRGGYSFAETPASMREERLP